MVVGFDVDRYIKDPQYKKWVDDMDAVVGEIVVSTPCIHSHHEHCGNKKCSCGCHFTKR